MNDQSIESLRNLLASAAELQTLQRDAKVLEREAKQLERAFDRGQMRRPDPRPAAPANTSAAPPAAHHPVSPRHYFSTPPGTDQPAPIPLNSSWGAVPPYVPHQPWVHASQQAPSPYQAPPGSLNYPNSQWPYPGTVPPPSAIPYSPPQPTQYGQQAYNNTYPGPQAPPVGYQSPNPLAHSAPAAEIPNSFTYALHLPAGSPQGHYQSHAQPNPTGLPIADYRPTPVLASADPALVNARPAEHYISPSPLSSPAPYAQHPVSAVASIPARPSRNSEVGYANQFDLRIFVRLAGIADADAAPFLQKATTEVREA